jgi:hypothetical protein
MIMGHHRVARFMDVPFASLKFVLTPDNTDRQKLRYEPYDLPASRVRPSSVISAGCDILPFRDLHNAPPKFHRASWAGVH